MFLQKKQITAAQAERLRGFYCSLIPAFTAAVKLRNIQIQGMKNMKKLIAIAFALSASAASADTWNCVCTQQDDFGACIAWTCDKDNTGGGVPDTQSLKSGGSELEQLLKKVDKTDTEVQISVSSK